MSHNPPPALREPPKKWQRARRSSNVEDRRGRGGAIGFGGRGIGGLGLGGLAIVVVVSLLLGRNPLELLGLLAQQEGALVPTQQGPAAPADDETYRFVSAILGSTEETWSALLQGYPAPTLVLFSGHVASACGTASSAVGPFYCPRDRQVYLDTGFFREMQARLGGGGDFAEAYVIAHEVGHHVQTLTGVTGRVNDLRMRGQSVEGASGPLVRQELQADCYAGVWAHRAQQQYAWLEPGDVEEALATASAIGDDRLQHQAQGTVVPDSFTHGTSEQRVRWFRTGFDTGDPTHCDTFAARQL